MKKFALVLAMLLTGSVLAQSLDVTFNTTCTTDIDSECYSLYEVTGLDPKGDAFLAVRAGPGSEYRMIDRLYNGDQVYAFRAQGSWYGIMYREGRLGWSHKKWLHEIGG